MNLKDVKPKDKITPKMLKGMAKTAADEQDYSVLFYFTENTFESFEACKAYWEEQDITDFGKALQKVMKAVQPKLDKFAQLNESIT